VHPSIPNYTGSGDLNVPQRPAPKEDYLVIVLSIAFIAGMAIALAIYFAWKSSVIAAGFHGLLSILALVVCPPFILAFALGPAADSDLAFALVVGTIVFANAFLYAGVAAGGYFVFTLFRKPKAS
jgi:hypothetical protein